LLEHNYMKKILKTKKQNISKAEITFYSISAFFLISGLTLAIISLVGDFMNVLLADNWVKNAEQAVINWSKINLDWLAWGTIFIGLATIISVITLLRFAKRDIVEKEKAMRRAQRLAGEVVIEHETAVVDEQ
jgi:hypothetical protein